MMHAAISPATVLPVRGPSRRLAGLLALAVFAALAVVDVWLVQEQLRVHAEESSSELTREWLLTTDGGVPERFGYAKLGAGAMLLVLVAAVRRRWLFAAWAAVLALALVDDSMQVHETAGGRLAERWALPEGVLGLRAQDLGEMAVWGLLAVLPLLVAAVLHWRSDRRTRRAGTAVAAVVALFAFCGIVLDQLHVIGASGPHAQLLTVLEDGGELVALSLVVALGVALLLRSATSGQPPADR